MPIDVQMPDGTIISGVPDNITQADLLARYKAYSPPKQEAAQPNAPVPDELGRYDVAKQPTSNAPTGLSAELAGEQFKSGVTGMQQGYYANAARNNAAMLNMMDAIDAGKKVTPIDDVLGYQDMSPEQRKQVRDSIQSSFTGTVAKTIKYGEEQKGYKRNPYADQVINLANDSNYKAAWNTFKKDPTGVLQQLTVESAPNALPSLVGGAAGVVLKGGLAGLMTGLASGSFPVEFVSSITDSLKDSGVDMSDDKAIEAKLRDPAFIEAAGKRAMTRGTVIAAADAASGKLLMPFKAGQIGKNVARAVGNVAMETGTEMGGEAAAQLATGEQLKPGDIIAEGLGAGPQTAATTAYKTVLESRKPTETVQPQPTPKPTVAPVPTPTPTPAQAVAPAPVEPAPVAPVSQAGGQDMQAMIDELRGITPAAPVEAQPVAQPVQQPVQVPQAVAPQAPATNVWESIQNRDRSTPASVAQMAKIANAPDYTRVSMSRDYGTGAPIVSGAEVNPAQLGRKDVVTGADGKKVPVQYAVIEAGDVIPSHNADGTKNPAYVDPSVPAFRAITNGRVAGLQAAYTQGTAQDYRNALIEDDLTGIDKSVVESMKNPMLVRVMPIEEVNQNTGDISNTGAGLTFNAVEQAKNDVNRIDLSTVQFNDSGDVSPQTVRDFIKAMPDTERGNLMDKEGNPTKQAVDRLNTAIFQQAYGNDKLTELGFQSQDEEARNIIRGLNMAASKAIQLADAGDYDVRPLVNEAVEMAINARRNGIKLTDLAKQTDMTANPLANDIIQMFADNPRSAKAIGENLSSLFTNASSEASKSGEDMFGAVPKRPVDQLIKDSFAKEAAPDLFTKPAEKPAAKPAEPSAGEPVADPKSITKPDPKWEKVKTGQAITLPMYQGRGESKAKIYNGVEIAVAGKGQYYAPTGKDAANYGDVNKYNITLENPLVITNDDEWRNLVKDKAGWRYPNPFNLSADEVERSTQNLKDYIMSQGHDSLVIHMDTRGDMAKTLRNVFGHDQAVVYKEQKAASKPAERPTEAADEPVQFKSKKPPEQIAKEIEVMTDGSQVAQWLVDNAPNEAAKAIADRLIVNIKAIEDSGVPIKIEVLHGNKRNNYYGSSGLATGNTSAIQYFKVVFNGLNDKGQAEYEIGTKESKEGKPTSYRPTGTRYSTLMHELLHVISQVQLDALIKRNFKGPEKIIYKELRSIYNAVKDKIEADKSSIPREQWHPLLKEVGRKNDRGIMQDIHELFVRSLTEKNVQAYLSTVNMGKKTALTKLMEVFRKVIGLNPDYQSALDRIMIVSEKIFAQTPADMRRLAWTEGFTFPTMKKEEVTADYEGEARNYKGQPVKATWDLPEDTTTRVLSPFDQTIEGLIYKFQDKQIDTKDAQKYITAAAGKIADQFDVYEQEQLYHGRTATGIREFLLNELMPAIKEIQKLGLTPQEVKDYLHNLHAEERNNKMNEVNKLDPVTGEERTEPWELQDRASGISTEDARKYLLNLDPKKRAALEKVAGRFQNMVKDTQKILVESGAESQDTVDAWNDTYANYVPLFRIEDDFNKVSGGMGATGASKGFGTRGGFSKRAMGSEKEVQDILGNLIAQRERALIRSEKIKVGKALYGLALTNPNPDVWLPVNPDAIKSKEALIKELEGLGFDDAETIANNLMQEPKTRYISKQKKIVTDPVTGLPMLVNEQAVKLKIDNLKRFGDNVFPIRIDGKDRYIFFNKNNPRAVRMVHSLLNLDVDNLGFVTSNIAKLTRWFASVNTQYNPIFGAVNLIRDVGGANFNLTSTPIAGEQAKVTKNIFPAMRGILNVLRDERKGKTDTKGKWAKAFQEFRKEGGQTGYRDSLIRTESEKKIVEQELSKMKAGNAKKAFTKVMGALSDFNDMMENSVRVAAYMAAIDKGLSPQKAAIVAKNLTVNFDKKGQLSAAINAYYAFFNASVQGTARLAQTLKGPKGKKIIAGGIALGTMQAVLLAAAGYDDDEPPEFVKERNFIIPLPTGKYISIPYPLGLHILPNIGRITTEFVLQGGKKAGTKVANLTGAFADAFSPVGSSGLSLQSALPTVLDPFAALEANKDAFGRPIYKKDQATKPTPGYLRSRESSSEISKTIAYYLNLASGGTKYSKGFISPTADEIDYVAGQITGGAGRELLKLEQSIKAGITGEELPSYRIPLAGRFYGETQSAAAESQRFYNNIIRMSEHENEIKGRIKNKEPVAPYMKDHPEARFWNMANNVENQVNALNKQKKEFIERDLPKDRIKRIDNQKTVIMKRFNDHLAKYED